MFSRNRELDLFLDGVKTGDGSVLALPHSSHWEQRVRCGLWLRNRSD